MFIQSGPIFNPPISQHLQRGRESYGQQTWQTWSELTKNQTVATRERLLVVSSDSEVRETWDRTAWLLCFFISHYGHSPIMAHSPTEQIGLKSWPMYRRKLIGPRSKLFFHVLVIEQFHQTCRGTKKSKFQGQGKKDRLKNNNQHWDPTLKSITVAIPQ